MGFRVRAGSHKPEVVDANGKTVPESVVHNISFPSIEQHGVDGITHEISGPGTATATINGKLVTGLPLC